MGLGADTTTFCFVRHGETAWNVERRLQGHLDVPLNDAGRAQAGATAATLAGHRFSAIYTSDLARARVTAVMAGKLLDLEPMLEPALRERHYGVFQGLTYDEARIRYPDVYARFIRRDPDLVFPEGGESLTSLSIRVSELVHRLARDHVGNHVLLVTHGGVLDIIHRLASGQPLDTPRDFTIPNAALNWVTCAQGQWKVLSWADHAHLPQVRDELPRA